MESGLLRLHSCVDLGRSFPFSRCQLFYLQDGRAGTRTVSKVMPAWGALPSESPLVFVPNELGSASLGRAWANLLTGPPGGTCTARFGQLSLL